MEYTNNKLSVSKNGSPLGLATVQTFVKPSNDPQRVVCIRIICITVEERPLDHAHVYEQEKAVGPCVS